MNVSGHKRFVLIGGGHGECGTNVIRRLLCRQPNVDWVARKDTFFLENLSHLLPFLKKDSSYYLPRLSSQKYIEFRNYIGDVFGNNSEVRDSLDFLESEIIVKTIYIPVFGKLPLPKNSSEEELQSIFQEFIEMLFSARIANPASTIGCEKTPSNAQYINLAQHIIPNSKMIIMQRHPIDLAVSLLNYDWGPNNLIESALFTRAYLDRWNSVKKKIDVSYYMVIRYEDLIVDPATELRHSCKFVGIKSDGFLSNEIIPADLITASNRTKLNKQNFMQAKTILASCCKDLGYNVDEPAGEYEWIK